MKQDARYQAGQGRAKMRQKEETHKNKQSHKKIYISQFYN